VHLNKNCTLVNLPGSKRFFSYKVKKTLTIFLILILPISFTQAANNDLAPVIHIVTEHLPPYQIVSEDNDISGFAVDIIKETMARSHYAYSLKSYPWVRSYKLAQRKVNHCIFSVARLRSRETLFKWVGPISKVNNTVIWARKDKNIEINNLEDAKNYTIAVNRNDIGHTGLMELGFEEDKHLYVLDNTESLVNLLITRPEIDLIVADDTTISFRAQLVGININKLQRVYEINALPLNFFFACSPQTDDKITEHLAVKLESIYRDGTHEAIWNKWKDKLIPAK
jgi:polar amino acid transport system substrate-binding protein